MIVNAAFEIGWRGAWHESDGDDYD